MQVLSSATFRLHSGNIPETFTVLQKSTVSRYLGSLLPLICSLNSYMGDFSWNAIILMWLYNYGTMLDQDTRTYNASEYCTVWRNVVRKCMRRWKISISLMYVGYWFVLLFNCLHSRMHCAYYPLLALHSRFLAKFPYKALHDFWNQRGMKVRIQVFWGVRRVAGLMSPSF